MQWSCHPQMCFISLELLGNPATCGQSCYPLRRLLPIYKHRDFKAPALEKCSLREWCRWLQWKDDGQATFRLSRKVNPAENRFEHSIICQPMAERFQAVLSDENVPACSRKLNPQYPGS